MKMEVSFILTTDELFTLITEMKGKTEAGKEFEKKALSGAVLCDLAGLAEKKLACIKEDEIELVPVMRMIIDAISNAEKIECHGSYWEVCSAWVTLRCEKYLHNENHWKISPIKEMVDQLL